MCCKPNANKSICNATISAHHSAKVITITPGLAVVYRQLLLLLIVTICFIKLPQRSHFHATAVQKAALAHTLNVWRKLVKCQQMSAPLIAHSVTAVRARSGFCANYLSSSGFWTLNIMPGIRQGRIESTRLVMRVRGRVKSRRAKALCFVRQAGCLLLCMLNQPPHAAMRIGLLLNWLLCV